MIPPLQKNNPLPGRKNLISVIIPTHNAKATIAKTLESVFRQSLPPDEILVVDDGSDDETPDLVASLKRECSTLRLIRLKSNSGRPSKVINVGVSNASGQFLATLDQDDLMHPNKLERQLECMTSMTDVGLVMSKFIYMGSEFSPLDRLDLKASGRFSRVPSRIGYSALIRENFAMSCSNFFFPRKIWEETGGFNEEITVCCDRAFLQAVMKNYDIGVVNEPLFTYFAHEDSLRQRSQKVLQAMDQMTIFQNFDAKRLGPQERKMVVDNIRIRFIKVLRHFIREKRYFRAAILYLKCLLRGGCSTTAMTILATRLPVRLAPFLKETLDQSTPSSSARKER